MHSLAEVKTSGTAFEKLLTVPNVTIHAFKTHITNEPISPIDIFISTRRWKDLFSAVFTLDTEIIMFFTKGFCMRESQS